MDFPPHFRSRMLRRGVSADEVHATLASGWLCNDARGDAQCRVQVFAFQSEWEGRWFAEKEVTVYFKYDEAGLVFITLKRRYGSGFPRGDRNEG